MDESAGLKAAPAVFAGNTLGSPEGVAVLVGTVSAVARLPSVACPVAEPDTPALLVFADEDTGGDTDEPLSLARDGLTVELEGSEVDVVPESASEDTASEGTASEDPASEDPSSDGTVDELGGGADVGASSPPEAAELTDSALVLLATVGSGPASET